LHDQPKGDDSGFRLPPTVAEDLSAQATTLIYVLAISPNHLTVPDPIGEIAKDSGDFGETDRIDRAGCFSPSTTESMRRSSLSPLVRSFSANRGAA
jgi:hypothetical protein